ncbi:MAG: hypothetical protein AMXMBFR12_08260 [Candidatus Babeliales bacterium]
MQVSTIDLKELKGYNTLKNGSLHEVVDKKSTITLQNIFLRIIFSPITFLF